MTYQDLKKQFDYVSYLFRDDVKWNFSVPQEPFQLDRTELIHFNKNISSEEAIKEMEEKGCRPATHLELIEWAKANSEEQRKYWIVALGSSTMRGDDRCVAVLYGDSDERVLGRGWFGRGWFGRGWGSGGHLLFVRKESSGSQTLGSSALENGALTLPLFIKACKAFVEVLEKGI